MSIPKKDLNSQLTKQAVWEVHITSPQKIEFSHYQVTNSNEQHQFDLFYVHDNVFKGNTYKKNMITGRDVASRYKVPRAVKTKKKKRGFSYVGSDIQERWYV